MQSFYRPDAEILMMGMIVAGVFAVADVGFAVVDHQLIDHL